MFAELIIRDVVAQHDNGGDGDGGTQQRRSVKARSWVTTIKEEEESLPLVPSSPIPVPVVEAVKSLLYTTWSGE